MATLVTKERSQYLRKPNVVGDERIIVDGEYYITPEQIVRLVVGGSDGIASVGLQMPSGFSVSNSPLIDNGVIRVSMADGYAIPTASFILEAQNAINWINQNKNKIVTSVSGFVEFTNYATASSYGLVKVAATRRDGVHRDYIIGSEVSNRYYGVEMDDNGTLFVNVPWTGGSDSPSTPTNPVNPADYDNYGLVKVTVHDEKQDGEVEIEEISNVYRRSYRVERTSDGHLFVNVPWVAGSGDGGKEYGAATTDTLGLVKVAGARNMAITSTTGETASNRYYGVEMDSNSQLFVNVPWESYDIADTDSYGLVKVANVRDVSSIKGEYQTGSTTSGRYYGVERDSEGTLFVNVPWVQGTGGGANPATATNYGTVKVAFVNQAKVDVEDLTEDVGRNYQVEMNIDGKLFVNVPWGAESASSATALDYGTVKVHYVNNYAVNPSLSSAADRNYGVEMDSNGKLFVNVPWEAESVSAATDSVYGTVKVHYIASSNSDRGFVDYNEGYDVRYAVAMGSDGKLFAGIPEANPDDYGVVKTYGFNTTYQTVENLSTMRGRNYGVETNSDGSLFVNVPWEASSGGGVKEYDAATDDTLGLVKVFDNRTINGRVNFDVDTDYLYGVMMDQNDRLFISLSPDTLAADSTHYGFVKVAATHSTAVAVQSLSNESDCNYQVEMNSDGSLFVNVPSTPVATDSVYGTVKVSEVLRGDVALGDTTRYYGVERCKDGTLVVNVPWVSGSSSTGAQINVDGSAFHGTVSIEQGSIASSAINNPSARVGRYYPVELSSDGHLFVCVPWTTSGGFVPSE